VSKLSCHYALFCQADDDKISKFSCLETYRCIYNMFSIKFYHTRDVKRELENRQPVLKPGTGLESEKPVIDFARVRTFTWVIGGSPAGARRVEGRSLAGPGAVPGR